MMKGPGSAHAKSMRSRLRTNRFGVGVLASVPERRHQRAGAIARTQRQRATGQARCRNLAGRGTEMLFIRHEMLVAYAVAYAISIRVEIDKRAWTRHSR